MQSIYPIYVKTITFSHLLNPGLICDIIWGVSRYVETGVLAIEGIVYNVSSASVLGALNILGRLLIKSGPK